MENIYLYRIRINIENDLTSIFKAGFDARGIYHPPTLAKSFALHDFAQRWPPVTIARVILPSNLIFFGQWFSWEIKT